MNENVEPTPTWLSTRISPKFKSTRSLAIFRPSPKPFVLPLDSAPSCLKRLNSSPRRCGSMPGPVSETEVTTWGATGSTRTWIRTCPGWPLNLIALTARLISTRPIFSGSQ